jgi:endonuclease/exonuclease/phosphatase family metal-dependent hydrolase
MEFSFLTYNIHKGIGNDRSYQLNRTIEVIRSTDADFIMLQEVDHHVPRSANLDTAKVIAEEFGLHYGIGLNVKLKVGAYGNATFSRFPILKKRNMDLTWGIKKARGVLITSLETPAGIINVWNYHLGLAGVERIWQVKKMLHSLHLRGEGSLPTIIVGDSNDRNHRLNPIFENVGFADTCRFTNLKTYPSYAPLWRLDKMYVSSHFSIREHTVIRTKLSRVASDHLPVLTTLKLRTPDE